MDNNVKLALEHPLRTIYVGSKAVILWPLKVDGSSLHFPAISKGPHALSNNEKGKQGHGHIRGHSLSLVVLRPTGSCTEVEAALKPFLSCYEGSLVVRVILQVSELDRRRPLRFTNFLRENTSFFRSKVSNPPLFYVKMAFKR